MKKYYILVAVLLIASIATFLLKPKAEPQVTSSGQSDLIRVTFPKEGSEISSTTPLTVTGEARGNWYFEASFPIIIVDWDGRIIGEGHAEAQGEWMTADYVPFKGTIEFTKPDYGTRGAVIFKKDNPSGESRFDDALEITIKFI